MKRPVMFLHRKVHAVYQIKNTITGDMYIGSTVDLYDRWIHHMSTLRGNKHHAPYLQHAWNKYGQDAFEMNILEYPTREELVAREQHYIDTMHPVYNTVPFADSPLRHRTPEQIAISTRLVHIGSKRSEESRKRMSDAAKVRFTDPEFLERFHQSRAALRKPKPEKIPKPMGRPRIHPLRTGPKQTREEVGRRVIAQRMAEGKSAFINVKPLTPEQRAVINAKLKGRIVSEETRKKLGKAWEHRTHSSETRAKIGRANSTRVWTAESRAKTAAALRQRYADGSKPRGGKLTAEMIAEIKARATGVRGNIQALAKEYGVCVQTIRNVLTGSTWT
jgi:group I intron endonuclease